MTRLKFFERCRTLKRILTIICICVGVLLGFSSFSIIEEISLVDCVNNRALILFYFGCCFFIMLILMIILLSCIIKDAEEDFNAIVKLTESKMLKE